MSKKTIGDAGQQAFAGKRVLVRVDFNVPQHDDFSVADDSRIRAALPTISYLKEAGAKVVLVSHLGRPRGASEKLSLKPIAARLSELMGEPVECLPDCTGLVVDEYVSGMRNGQVCLLENVRFHPEEESNDPEFARKLASVADVYVNDAFGTAHRAHASTQGVSRYLRPALAGFLMEREISALSQALESPARPFATIIGGSKVSSKIGVLEHLLSRVDVLVIGGAMAFSFLKAEGKETGKSLVEDDRLDFCRQLEKKARSAGVKLVLPVDVVCAPEMKAGVISRVVSVDSMPTDQIGLDIGPATVENIRQAITPCRTVVWNGPLGVFEIAGFDGGTNAVIDMLVVQTQSGTRTIVGGGDSVAAIEARGIPAQSFSHVSTGGGASLEFLEGLELPGIACLDEAEPVSSGANF